MKTSNDFSEGRRGGVVPLPPGKTRITIRLDNEILDWFRGQVDARGGGSYQSMINDALKDHVRRGRRGFGALFEADHPGGVGRSGTAGFALLHSARPAMIES